MSRRSQFWTAAAAIAAAAMLIVAFAVMIWSTPRSGDSVSATVPRTLEPGVDPHETSWARERLETKQRLLAHFDLSNLLVEVDDLMPGTRTRDAILALVSPNRRPVARGDEIPDDDRLVVVSIASESVAYPMRVLGAHEIINDTVGGTAIAVTYCPLCDSAVVFERTFMVLDEDDGGQKQVTLEFGVSGLLLHSTLVMYDRTFNGLWGQVDMRAISGPLSGHRMTTRPFGLMTLSDYFAEHPEGSIVSYSDTGHPNIYVAVYFNQTNDDLDHLFMEVPARGRELPPRTPGIGILDGERAIFISRAAIEAGHREVQTSAGMVRLGSSDVGVFVIDAPPSVSTVNAFYFGFSAHHPGTVVIAQPGELPSARDEVGEPAGFSERDR